MQLSKLSKLRFLAVAIVPVFALLPASAGSGQTPAAVPNPFVTATNQTQPAPASPPPPEVKPYEIPRFNGREGEDFHHIPAIKPAKQIDGDAIFEMIVNCFPERGRWGGSVKAQAGARWTESNRISALDDSGLARHYVGVVAEMPLWSPEETYRQQEQERNRRAEAANRVAALLKGVADRQRAWRMIGISESVEARSQLRVQRGITSADEQITHLYSVAEAVSELDAANAAIVSARLALAGQCRDEVRGQVNSFLVRVTQ